MLMRAPGNKLFTSEIKYIPHCHIIYTKNKLSFFSPLRPTFKCIAHKQFVFVCLLFTANASPINTISLILSRCYFLSPPLSLLSLSLYPLSLSLSLSRPIALANVPSAQSSSAFVITRRELLVPPTCKLDQLLQICHRVCVVLGCLVPYRTPLFQLGKYNHSIYMSRYIQV